jgi:hypothetical protein
MTPAPLIRCPCCGALAELSRLNPEMGVCGFCNTVTLLAAVRAIWNAMCTVRAGRRA